MPSKKNKREAASRKAAEKAQTEATNKTEETAQVEEPKAQEVEPPKVELPKTQQPKSEISSEKAQQEMKPAPFKQQLPHLNRLPVNKNLKVLTNSFPVTIAKKTVIRYDVVIEKCKGREVERIEKKQGDLFRQLVAAALQNQHRVGPYLYDGVSIMYTLDTDAPKDKSFCRSDNTELLKRFLKKDEDASILVRFNKNSAASYQDLKNVLAEDQLGGTKVITTILHLLLAQQARDKNFLVMDSQFYSSDLAAPRNGKQEREGVGAGIKVAEGDKNGEIHVVLDYKKSHFFPAGPLSDLSVRFNDYAHMSKMVKGLQVSTNYKTPQHFNVDAISAKRASELRIKEEQKFLKVASEVSGKPESSFRGDFHAVQRKVKMFDENGSSRTEFYSFPIENLKVAPNQKMTQKHGDPPPAVGVAIRFRGTKNLGVKAGLFPPQNSLLSKFGVSVNSNPITVQASTIPLPTILLRGMTAQPDFENNASWPMKNKHAGGLLIPKTIDKVLILYNSRTEKQNDPHGKVERLKENLIRQASNIGMTITAVDSEDLRVTLPKDSEDDAILNKMEKIKQDRDKQQKLTGKPPGSLVIFYADNSDEPTHGVLKLAERRFGFPTAHLAMDKSLRNPGAITMGNVLMKVNSKMGGLNFRVQPKNLDKKFWGPESKTLIISYDVCHASGQRQYRAGEICEEPAVVGFGHNGGPNPEIVLGDFHYQLPRQEKVDDAVLNRRVTEIVNSWVQFRKSYPETILILRDGVSEGQYQMVLDEEFFSIKRAVNAVITAKRATLKPPTNLKYAVLVATKRHSNRLALLGDGGALNNVAPLTAIDHTIVRKNANELIFVSHHPLSGTAQPVLLNILHNEGVFQSHDQVTQLMAALCCVHQASSIVVSLPETIFAADEYAKRGADIFAAYKKRFPLFRQDPNVPNSPYDFEKLTDRLCYGTSVFKNVRIV